ncbi:peptidyl-prolyl cis-trans isomerase FKBP53 isoform X2 [Macadamia integrifolia]|uniref:peptidyl-prolyl cis-trans isomerase FKBP53 isoform X2 n=1 Tax=Macadamia integrifolia TaxID=60698 RepID=UPI001C4F47CD|nr:peptidyl-prolyl cis-trans isomerase FKBP53 isoform X2 [Macadamia integrifolia]
MAFWGVELKPGKPHTHRFDDERGRLHISHATLGIGKSTKRTLVQCNVGDKSPIFICSLLPDKIEYCTLDLEFEEEDDVVFSVIGPQSVHLCGYYLGNGQDSCGHEDDSDSYGEDIAQTETEDSTDYDTEDEFEGDFIDDSDLEAYQSSPVPNSGVVIEEILDDEKLPKENGNRKHPHKKGQVTDSDDDNSSQRQIVVRGTSGAPVLESEDEDGFPVTSSLKSIPTVQNNEAKVKERREKKKAKDGKKNTKEDSDQVSGLKRKIDTVQDGNPEGGDADQSYDSSVPSTEVVKSKKKKKKQVKEGKITDAGNDNQISLSKEDAAQPGEAKSNEMDQDLPSNNKLDQKLADDESLDLDVDHAATTGENSEEKKKKKKKKNKNKNKTQESDENAKASEVKNQEGDVNAKATLVKTQENDMDGKASKVRTFPNGLVIEELAMGKPDGKRASPGKKVSVRYIGKLKKNGQIFDSNIGRAPFKFRLGVGEVIKGWDVGVNGMRVGDKRRLVIPPSMGYGSQGAGGKIPPNSWLTFDVELVNVN